MCKVSMIYILTITQFILGTSSVFSTDITTENINLFCPTTTLVSCGLYHKLAVCQSSVNVYQSSLIQLVSTLLQAADILSLFIAILFDCGCVRYNLVFASMYCCA